VSDVEDLIADEVMHDVKQLSEVASTEQRTKHAYPLDTTNARS
jgi:hypothetical protein